MKLYQLYRSHRRDGVSRPGLLFQLGLAILICWTVLRHVRPLQSAFPPPPLPPAESSSELSPTPAAAAASAPGPGTDGRGGTGSAAAGVEDWSASLAGLEQRWRREADLNERDQLLQEFCGSFSAAQILRLLDHLARSQEASEVTVRLPHLLLQHLVRLDAKVAVRWVTQLPAGRLQDEGIATVAGSWARLDLAGASAWIEQLEPGANRDRALLPLAYELAQREPIAALKLASSLSASSPSSVQDELVTYAASHWAGQNPQAALAWASQAGDEALRGQLMSTILTTWSAADPAAAAASAVQILPPGKPQDDAVVGILQRWTQGAPAEAAAWVAGFPAGLLRDAASRELITQWPEPEIAQAAEWINGLPVSSHRDEAICAYASRLLPVSPPTAAAWAARVGESNRRISEMTRIAESWLELDAPAARSWIEASTLPTEAKQQLLGSKPRQAGN